MLERCEGIKVPVYAENGLCITPITGLPFTATQTIVVTYCRRFSAKNESEQFYSQEHTKKADLTLQTFCSWKASLHSASYNYVTLLYLQATLAVFKRLQRLFQLSSNFFLFSRCNLYYYEI